MIGRRRLDVDEVIDRFTDDRENLTVDKRLALQEALIVEYRHRARRFVRLVATAVAVFAAAVTYGQVRTGSLADQANDTTAQVQHQRRENLRLSCEREHQRLRRARDVGQLTPVEETFLKPVADDCERYAERRVR